jgi:diaminohydroxyphosphoribosylaminopyrimidine deaminase/5-amino-6-(5-phosphoribosylamino)uracil reductase
LYVNLEPCNFHGKTPPCTDLVISSGIRRVVVGSPDPNPRVRGRGIRQLRAAGITVTGGVLEEECGRLNESFTKYVSTGLPFVTLKIAQTLDGKIADRTGRSRWITNALSRQFVHRLRSLSDAVLVGAETVRRDDPRLTVRRVRGKNPLRVVLDGNCTADPGRKVFSPPGGKTILFVSDRALRLNAAKIKRFHKKGVMVIPLPGDASGMLPLKQVLRVLGQLGVASLLVEGGAKTFSGFLRDRLSDKLFVIIAPRFFGQGLDPFTALPAQRVQGKPSLRYHSLWNIQGDIVIEAYHVHGHH